MSANRVYVNNLPYSIKEEGIASFFAAAGPVSNVEIFTWNGRSKGCALVTFEDDASAAKAIAELNEKDLEGRPVHIREDRGEREKTEKFPAPVVLSAGGAPSGERSNFRNRNRNNENGEGARMPPSRPDDHGRKIFVGNLSFRTEWQSLKDLFRDCGEIIRADVAKMPDGRSRGFGTVVFATEAAAQAAINTKHDTELEGRRITVRLDRMTGPAAQQ